MVKGIRGGIVPFFAVALASGVFAQTKSGEPGNTVHISGKIVSATGVPIAERTVTFSSVAMNGRPQGNNLKTDDRGVFALSIAQGTIYQINLVVSENPLLLSGIGIIEVVEERDVDMGDIVLEFSPGNEASVHLSGPIQLIGSSKQTSKATSIAAVYMACSDIAGEFCTGGTMRIVHSDGKQAQPPNDKEQVGSNSALISEDKRAAGWLVDYKNCCASYPLAMKLMIYRPGQPLRSFKGDGRAIFDWHFVAGGKQVAFYQDFPHGTPAQHYELRDVATSRLSAKWDGDLTSRSPEWAKGLGTKPGF